MNIPTVDLDQPVASLRPIPTRTEDLTVPWLTASLRSSGMDVEVGSFRATEFGEGAGMMSRLVRVELDYARGSGPPSVVVKLPCANEANRAVSIDYHLYRREVLFYREAAPRTPARTVATYYADIDGETDFVLVLEDLAGYHIGDQIVGCTVAQARLCMPMMAELHASFWNKVDHLDFDFIPYHYPSFQSDNLYQGALAGWDTMAELAGDALPQPLRDLKPRYLNAIPRMQEWITAEPRTIVHGDFRMDNLFFGQDPGHSQVAICDWQGILRGKGAHDLAYFLSQSMPVEDRRAHERDLVARWHAGLVAGGVSDYSAERAWEDYRRAIIYLWTYVAVIAGTLDPTNERGRGWMREMVRRSATAILDLGLIELLTEFE
jgi:hypothetical protein